MLFGSSLAAFKIFFGFYHLNHVVFMFVFCLSCVWFTELTPVSWWFSSVLESWPLKRFFSLHILLSSGCKAPLCSFGVSPFLQLVILNPWKGRGEGMIWVYLKRRINLSPSSPGDPEEAVLSLHWLRPAAVCCRAFLMGQALTNSVSQHPGRRWSGLTFLNGDSL